jgi:hypothetical protein
MILPLVVCLVGWNDPAGLLPELSSDSIEWRERAAFELLRRGREIRPCLTDALQDSPEPEVRARIAEILRRLEVDDRIRWFGGYNRVAGFGASLRSDRFFGGGPFRLTLEIMNLSPRDQVLPEIRAWDAEFPDQEVRGTGAEAKVMLKKFIGSTGLRRTTWRSGEGGARSELPLRPGESARFEYVIDAKSLPPGDYDVTVEYDAPTLLPGAEERLRSNTVRLTIRK